MGSVEVSQDFPKTKDVATQTDAEQPSEKSAEDASPGSRMAAGSIRTVLKKGDWVDTCLMVLGTLGSVADGMTLALMMLVLSTLMNGYGSAHLRLKDVDKFAQELFYVAIGVGCGAFFEGFCWARVAERLTFKLRREYLQAVLQQDVGFFDERHGQSMTSDIVSSISVDTLAIQGVLAEKMPNFIMNITMFIGGQFVAIYLSWRLAVVAIPALLMLIIPGIVYGKMLADVGERMQESYGIAGGIVQQALASIRTVYSYVGEERTLSSYRISLEPLQKLGVKQGFMKGMAMGTIGITYAVWALQGWYGSVLITKNREKGGDVFTAGVCIIYGGLALGGSLLNLKYISEGNIAAARIYKMIERVPSIDPTNKKGTTMSNVRGEVEFKEVDFAYPARPDTMVLRKFNLRVMASQTVGLVGRSGSGKSTFINLLERFYDPVQGTVYLDGINIRTLQVEWLRRQMGLVSQEPILFATTIKDNILFGKEGASMDEVIAASKAANAHGFILMLPNGYDTQVGQLGSQMSEGQKQRITIARALLRDPRVLLLDEPTSALDSHSEKAVQDALNQASVGRTTIIIAHRLSTLSSANAIAVVQNGQVVEFGSPGHLLSDELGAYSVMVRLQQNFGDNRSIQDSENILQDESVTTSKKTTLLDEITNDPHGTSPRDKPTPETTSADDSPSLWKLLDMVSPEWKSTVLGCCGAIGYGLVMPMYYYCLGSILSVYVLGDSHKVRSKTRVYCLAFTGFAIVAFVANVVQHYFFGVMGEFLTKGVREAVLSKILTFEIGWFDQEDNSSGALCSRLATDAVVVKALVADRLSFFTQSIASASLAVIMGMILSWKLSLVATGMQPVIIGAFYLRAVTMRTMSKRLAKAQNESSGLASEALANHRIITAFGSGEKIMKLYEITQIGPKQVSHKQSWYAGFGLFVSMFLTSANGALIFWYGGWLLFHGKISYQHLFQVFFVLVSTGRVIAETGSLTADLSKGMSALKSIHMILNRKSEMKPDDPDGIDPESILGEIEFKRVSFNYSNRPEQRILKDVSLHIDAGKVVALVGQSGSGKSTIIRLVERFYDPSHGSVEIDGIDLRRYNLRKLRSHISLVSQDPALFTGTIRDNIRYGKESATDSEVVAAATLANAHQFISTMEEGYRSNCGERGVQLSGGQKQRIALARAILKDPAILLLDEATSALDSESENLIQEALTRTMSGRTCVMVAHRLSTIRNADKIFVIESGRIIEEGLHEELLDRGETGAYASLIRLQQISSTA
ncbi:hypothetical protein MLD38_015269 [Melastoma candidum]|uniref:Uncharacterized protein n=1 Tax=Melastoma candidum TaxID=119954 RepID=A0ACB9RF70_9MYRT|nr:hypothetical protein MLD38_015269 [Melastoma candidum]